METNTPQIELMPDGRGEFVSEKVLPWHRAPRARLFFLIFLIIATVGLGYTFSQPSIYQSRASVLMAALTAVDRNSDDADIQHVAIQRRILLGSELVERTQSLLLERGYTERDIGRVLDVEPVEDTNLVEMVAQGTDAAFLPVVINTWIEVYLAARADDIAQSVGETHNIISEEIVGLEQKVELARRNLVQYRLENNIVSAERAENEALARLKGINNSLNNTLEDEVRAKSELDSILEAIGRGDTVVPKQEQQTFSKLEIELQQMKLQLSELDQRYTREYLARQPALKVLPQNIAKLEEELARRRVAGGRVVVNDATQAYMAAQKTVVNIRQQYAEHKKEVEEFTRIFQVHQSMVIDLEELETLQRDSQSRLVQLETSQIQRYPQVNVIAAATMAERVGPNYLRNAALALGLAILLAIFIVWLSSFLGHQKSGLPPITITGVQVYPGEGKGELAYQPSAKAALEKQAHALENTSLDEAPPTAEPRPDAK